MQVNIIGYGNMGSAIAKALIASKQKIRVIITDNKRVAVPKGAVFDVAMKTLPKADVVLVAVKPQDVPGLADVVQGKIRSDAVLVSIAAGITIAKLAGLFHHRKIIRMMPNIGLSVGQGIAAWKSAGLSSAEKKQARMLLDAISENFEVSDEKLIDAVTAISGSGPAYYFLFSQCLCEAAEKLGLTAPQARMLVGKTMEAAATLQRHQDFQELINRVASKGGTTEAALKVFKKINIGKIVNEAVRAAHKRAGELRRE